MFFDNNEFPFTSDLEFNWQIIKEEFNQLQQSQLISWPEKDIYNQGWKVFNLYAFQKKNQDNCLLCPQTTKLIEKIPNAVSAGFSCLSPGTKIFPHSGFPGYSKFIFRCHLGLIIPSQCAIKVGSQTKKWQTGKCLVFDDSVEHEAWNLSIYNRIILLVDFLRPTVKNSIKFQTVSEVKTKLQDIIKNEEINNVIHT